MRRAPEGSALWTPAGAYAPDPEMLRISASPAGGTGVWGCGIWWCAADLPAKRLGGQVG